MCKSFTGSRLSVAHTRFNIMQQFHGIRASRFQAVALAFAPRSFALQVCKVALALARRNYLHSFSRDSRILIIIVPKEGFRIMRVQQLRWFSVLKS
eukprot:9484209-Pyramimonas_sp.AAC.1